MAQILKLDDAYAARVTRARAVPAERHDDDDYSFWPEVACGLWSKAPHEVDPRNSAGRVLSEMMLIIGGASLLVLLTTVFLGAPSP